MSRLKSKPGAAVVAYRRLRRQQESCDEPNENEVRRSRVHGWLRLAAFLILSAGPAFGADRPNIVFILSDDQAWWDYSFMRRPGVEKAAIDLNPSIYQVAKTPAIDRLADAGLTFTHGYSMPVCRPSLASIITGAFPHQHYITGNDLVAGGVRVPDETVEYRMQVFQTLPRILATRLGYTSFQTGKWWEGHHTNGGFTNGGFRAGDTANSVSTSNPDTRPPQWSGSKPGYVPARHGDWGLMIGRVDYVNDVQSPAHPINYANTIVPVTDFIDAQVAAHQPFFLWYAPMLPHGPYDPPSGLRSIYDTLIAEPDEAGDPFAIQYANIERFDGGVGALLDHLDAVGIASNTIVVLLADNGYIPQTPSAYAPKSKTTPYEGGVRTPIIVRWPNRIKAGGALPPQIIAKPVSIVDLVPTVLAAVGLEPSPEMTGVNLLDLNAVAARDTVFGEDHDLEIHNLSDPSASLEARFAIRDGWKLILSTNGSSELYHLYNSGTGAPVDPFETNNVSGSNPALVSNLTAAINSWYDAPKSLEWQTGLSQPIATHLLSAPNELGQTFTPTNNQYLAAVRVALKPIAPSQAITLELRALDGTGAPLGSLLASATVSSAQLVANQTRWYLFALNRPVALTAQTNVGFRLVSTAGPGGFEAAYRDPGFYSGGRMYYSGLVNGNPWAAGACDLAFEALCSSYGGSSRTLIGIEGGQAHLSGLMAFKGFPVILQSSTNLQSWSNAATHSNLDGLVSWMRPANQSREFFRIGPDALGAAFTLTSTNPSTLYAEDFAGPATNLNGVMPDTTLAGAQWTAPTTADFRADGSLQNANATTAYLPLSPANGFVYTLTVQVAQGGADAGSWVAFGFLRNPPNTAPSNGWDGEGPHLGSYPQRFHKPNQVLHENVNGGAGSVASGDFVTGAATLTMSLVLDTTGGSGNWNYNWIVNGTVVTNRTLSASFESAIGGVGIAKHGSFSPTPSRPSA